MGKGPLIVRHKGSLAVTEKFLKSQYRKKMMNKLNQLGQMGVDALAAATPVRTGKTAASWRYEVIEENDRISLQWLNDNTTESGDCIVRLLVRGHGTRDGHYVRGNDFITPAMEPVFKEIADQVFSEVVK